MAAEIRAKIAVDTSDLSRADQAVRNFETTLKQGFRREPGRRGAVALEQSIQQLTSGNVGGAIEAIATKFSGLGLAGGAALGLIAVGFAKVIEGAKEWEKAITNAQNTLRRTPAAGASMELLQKHIEATSKAMEELGQKSKAWTYAVPFGDLYRAGTTEIQKKQAADLVNTLDRQLEKSKQMAQVEELKAAGYKNTAAALKEQIDLEEKLANIHEQARSRIEEVKKAKLPKEERQATIADIKDQEAAQKELAKATAERQERFKTVAPYLEKGKLTGKEIQAGEGLLSDRLLSQQADAADKMGENFKKQGFAALAGEQFARADAWRSQMTGLKEAEKPEAGIAAAISNAAVFLDILNELQGINSGVNNISFKNK